MAIHTVFGKYFTFSRGNKSVIAQAIKPRFMTNSPTRTIIIYSGNWFLLPSKLYNLHRKNNIRQSEQIILFDHYRQICY